MKLPIFNHTAHKELWNWLASNLTIDNFVEKSDWPGWKKYERQSCLCFACDYDERATAPILIPDCSYCPLKWPNVAYAKHTHCLRSIYGVWEDAVGRYDALSPENIIQLKEVAKQIANLPVKDGVECI